LGSDKEDANVGHSYLDTKRFIVTTEREKDLGPSHGSGVFEKFRFVRYSVRDMVVSSWLRHLIVFRASSDIKRPGQHACCSGGGMGRDRAVHTFNHRGGEESFTESE
jgi:hypothetical protein